VRKSAAQTEPAWAGCGQTPGVKVWRIEHFTVQDVAESSYGQFHKGDSYIVLDTKQVEERLERTVFFWLGSETSVDEQGTAAYKTVELDDFFDGEPKESREVEGEESAEFKALFGGSITYLAGGIDSGFKHVTPAGHDPKFWVVRRQKGQTKVIQSPLKKHLVNDGDCFVLDAPGKIYVYDGPNSSPFEKQAANQKAEHIENLRDGEAAQTHDIDDGFWSLLE